MTSSPPNPTSKIRVDIKSFHVVRFAGGDVRRTEGALHPPISSSGQLTVIQNFHCEDHESKRGHGTQKT